MAEFCKNITLLLNQSHPTLDSLKLIDVSSLVDGCRELETEDKYSEPMVLIGCYITLALALCNVVMMSDLTIGFLLKKVLLSSKLLSLNAFYITVIAVATKLPMDLSTPMPAEVDQVAKVGGLAFMCTMMCNFMPSLASMDNKSLVANVAGLSILVITLVVDVGIQIKTRAIRSVPFPLSIAMPPFLAAYIYMGMLLFLLLIFISSAVAIPRLKKVVELKYQATLNDQNLREDEMFNVEKLKQLLIRHLIMAETGSPEFVMANTPLSSASSIICAVGLVVYLSFWPNVMASRLDDGKSVYKFTTIPIFNLQSLAVLFGVVPIYRYIAILGLRSFSNQAWKPFSVFKVEKYWTLDLCEWKERPLSFSATEIEHRLKNNILSIFILFQKVIVVLCKILELIPIAVIIFVVRCLDVFKSLKAMFSTPSPASSSEDAYEDLRNCVLLLEDDVQLTEYSVERFFDSLNSGFTEPREQTLDNNLLKLLEKSVAFEGVETFDTDQIQPLLHVEVVNCWSLPIISLTCIAISIPNIDNEAVDNLFTSVGKGIYFTLKVESALNKASEYVHMQRATMNLWREVKHKTKWLDTTLKRSAYEGKAPTDIIKSFAHLAEDIVTDFNRGTNAEPVTTEKLPWKVIAANSMYRVAQTIIHTYESSNLEINEDELFSRLSGMIADILAACLTNIPRVIIMKCRESAIEKRQDSVSKAVRLLQQTSEIIKRLETRQLPNLHPEKMGFIDEWRLHFKQP